MKIIKISKLLLLLLCLSVCKILIPFTLSFSFQQNHSLLVRKVSYILKSSKLVMFFVFHFILMAILLMYAKQPQEDSHMISFKAPAASEYEEENEKDAEDCEGKSTEDVLKENIDKDKNYDGVSEVGSDNFHGYDGDNDDDDDDDDDDIGDSVDDCYSEDEKEDDLNKRIEEFIAKNNRKWEEEQLNDKSASFSVENVNHKLFF